MTDIHRTRRPGTDGYNFKCNLTPDELIKWKEEAARRHITMGGLLGYVLSTIAQDNLFKAILDEDDDDNKPRLS